MKIDYELAEKIGATHYDTDNFNLFKLSDRALLKYKDENWSYCNTTGSSALTYIKLIPSKPPVTVEHEKVTKSIFDLKDEFERGELYEKDGESYIKITLECDIVGLYPLGLIYRRIEKPVDWREVTSKWVQENQSVNIDFLTNAVMYYHGSVSNDKFLEMCRVALRANGEL